ncbi:MAG: DNA primase [Bacteroidales bacterium]|nr:DNA primase [Bacteroidales bacterium]
MIPKETVQTIIETARIDEVVGEFVSLKRRGVNLIGSCPFHNEKTPSFNVNPARNIFKCFGCGEGGDSVSFLMKHEHFTYVEALRHLAKKYGIPIQEQEQTPEMIQQMNEREGLFNVTEFAKKYFVEILHDNDIGRSIGLSYFRERGFSPATIEKFQLGYCLDEWESFTKTAITKGYNADYLVKTGLSVRKDDGTLFDRFKGRVMFPIHNLSGRTIGFGGRTLSSDKKVAKYVNSPESDIYSKSKVLYGLYFSKSAIVKQDSCLLVEGYTDVISLHQAGVENVVASSGTALTVDQIKLISRYTKNVVVLFDGDEAGIKASFRGLDMILKEGLNVRIVSFPDGQDPDSFARSHRSEDVQKFIAENAVDFIRFKANLLLKETAGDPIKKANLLKDIVESIALIPDAISRSVYTAECSRILDFPETVLIAEINKILRTNFKKQHSENVGTDVGISTPLNDNVHSALDDARALSEVEGQIDAVEREIIRILINYHQADITVAVENADEVEKRNVGNYIFSEISNDELLGFENSLYRLIFDAFSTDADRLLSEAEAQSVSKIDDGYFSHHENENIKQLAIDLMNFPHAISENYQKKGVRVKKEHEEEQLSQVVSECLSAFRLCKLEKMIDERREKLRAEKDEDNLQILIAELARFERARVQISNLLGRVVTK